MPDDPVEPLPLALSRDVTIAVEEDGTITWDGEPVTREECFRRAGLSVQSSNS